MIEFNELEGANPALPGKSALRIWTSTGKIKFYKITVQDPRFDPHSPGFILCNSWEFDTRQEAVNMQGMVSEAYHNFKPYQIKFRKDIANHFRTKNIQGVYRFIEERIDAELVWFYVAQNCDGFYHSSIGNPLGVPVFMKQVPYHVAIDLCKIEVTTDYMQAIINCQRRIKHYA